MVRVPYINTVATGENINRMRMDPQAIYKWIHGTAMPSIDNLVILAAVLGVTMDEIIVVDTPASKCG